MSTFLSIIIPVYNCELYVVNTLKSIENSIDYFYRNNPLSPQFITEVIIVDDASTDSTLNLVDHFVRYKKYYKVLAHGSNLGASSARNTGFKLSQGDYIFFCDGDDLFLEYHLDYCLRVFSDSESKPTHSGLAAVKTEMKIPLKIHDQWKQGIEHCSPINLCVKRTAHEFLEGFPEHHIYKLIGGEDCAYNRYLHSFFSVAKINVQTVEYVLKPGNSLDRQRIKFSLPPGSYQEEIPLKERLLRPLTLQIEQNQLTYLQEKQKLLSQIGAKESD